MQRFFKKQSGFSILELIVTVSILSVILTVIVYNQSTYTDGLALSNLADEVSLTISQAQAYGIGVREFAPGSSEFSASYGLVFNLSGSGSKDAYIYFADRSPGNGIYDGDWSCSIGGASECLEKIAISRNNQLDSLCIVRSSNPDYCNIDSIYITFARPKPEANLLFFNGIAPVNFPDAIGAKIVLSSPGGASRAVIVYSTGQTSVQ